VKAIYVWIVVGVAVAILIGLVLWQHFYPPAGSKISNKVIVNKPLGIQRTRILPHPGLPIKKASNAVKRELANLTRDETENTTTKGK
jgi:hypothetical protein